MECITRNGVKLSDYAPTFYDPRLERSNRLYCDIANPLYKPAIRNGVRDDIISTNGLVLNAPFYLFKTSKFRTLDRNKYIVTNTGATWTPQGWVFDGGSDKAAVTIDAKLQPTLAITLECWFNLTSNITQYDTIIGTNNDAYTFYFPNLADNKVAFTVTGASGASISTATAALTTGIFYHLVGTYTSGVGGILYINGTSDATSLNKGNIIAAQTPLTFGGKNAAYFVPGKKGVARIYNRAWSAGEVSQVYNATKWRFNV
jgi:hypothetical protein